MATRTASVRTAKILLIDDDEDLRDTLNEQIALHEEFEIESLGEVQAGLDYIANNHIDIVLLDIGLPDMDGRELCGHLRRQGFSMPILMLTGATGEADTILGLNSGANDYITKPFRFGVLLARLRAHLRQHEQNEMASFKIGPYVFRPGTKQLCSDDGNKIRLTEKEASILKYLYRAGAQPVSREVLLHEIWGYRSDISTHTLETHIYRLRQKIEADPTQSTMLITVPGGYKLIP
jgi:DNA-binding response OmpR family regulator